MTDPQPTAADLLPGDTIDHPILGAITVVRVGAPLPVYGGIPLQFGDGTCLDLDPGVPVVVVSKGPR